MGKDATEDFIRAVLQKTESDKKAFGANAKVTVEHQGKKIILPALPRKMTEDEGITHLTRIMEQGKKKVGIHETVDAFPLEGAWALRKVLEEMFGNVLTADAKRTMFGEIPGATMVNIEVAPGKEEQVLWGRFHIPGVDGELVTGFEETEQSVKFAIKGTVLQKDRETVKAVADAVRAYIAEHSLYKGKAIKITTKESQTYEGRYVVDFNNPPRFIDTSKVREKELVFSAEVRTLIDTNLYTPIEHTEQCRELGIPLKRAILLEGPYGTGKTLTAYVTAKKAEQNGWTFVYMDRAQALRDVLIFARKYAPVVIFCEDVEQVVGMDRDTDVNDVLNNIDGLDSKDKEVLCVFTTNHVEKINPAMLRAGRLDAVVSVEPPDAQAAEQLIRIYSRGLLEEKTNLKEAASELAGQIPAFIREVVERSKLYAVRNTKAGQPLQITGDDLRMAAIGMKKHFALVNVPKAAPLSPGDELALALNRTISGAFSEVYDDKDRVVQHRREIARAQTVN